MDARALIIEPGELAALHPSSGRLAAIVDLDRIAPDWCPDVLPAFPVLAIGPVDHPAAAHVDAVAEASIGIDAMVRGIASAPQAAAVAACLLRRTAGLAVDVALEAESLAYGLLQAGAEHRAWLDRREGPAQVEPGRVHIKRHDDRLTVTIDRPEAHGAVDRIMRDGLREAFTIPALDRDIAQVVLRGIGAAFSIGGDLAEFGTTRDPAAAHLIRLQTLPAWPLSRCADRVEAHVHGACIGAGIEMAAFAGRVIATGTAWFQLPELAMGLIPGAGGTVSLTRRIGRQRTAALILSGRRISARTALAWGLVDEIVNDLPAGPG